MALFGMTAKEWRTKNPNLDGNIRDYATMNELICLANLENLNSVFINEGLKQSERFEKLNKIAINLSNSFINNSLNFGLIHIPSSFDKSISIVPFPCGTNLNKLTLSK